MEEVGSAIDTFKIVNIASQVFRRVREDCTRWKLARVIAREEEEVREILEKGMRERSDPKRIRELAAVLVEKEKAEKPSWIKSVNPLRAAVRIAIKLLRPAMKVHKDADDADLVFGIMAQSDEKIRELLDAIESSTAEAVALVSAVRNRIDWIRGADEYD